MEFLKDWSNIVMILIVFIVFAFLYNRFLDKHSDEGYNNYDELDNYLLQKNSDLEKVKKPILWIYIPNHEKNSRNWLNFGSRLTNELNQPYLYLTVKSIVHHCKDSFHICMFDDESFEKLLPSWNIDIKQVGSPVVEKIRTIGMMKLLSTYGGMIVPISFVCLKDLKELYETGTRDGKIFLCEKVDNRIHSTETKFYPSINFMGVSGSRNPTIDRFLSYLATTLSADFTSESVFLDKFNTWMKDDVGGKKIHIIDGIYVGVKDMEGEPILLEHLMSDNYIDFYSKMYGIWISRKQLLKRLQYGWFVRSSPKQVLQANTILSKYMLLANSNESNDNYVIERMRPDPDWVGFYDTPLKRVWGLKPNYLGNNVLKYDAPENPGT